MDHWGIDRVTGDVFYTINNNRSGNIMKDIVINNVKEKSIIINDEWKDYNVVKNDFRHYTICHKKIMLTQLTKKFTHKI